MKARISEIEHEGYGEHEYLVVEYGKSQRRPVKRYSDCIVPALTRGSLCAIRELQSKEWCDGIVSDIKHVHGKEDWLVINYIHRGRRARDEIQRWHPDLHHRPKRIRISNRLKKWQDNLMKGKPIEGEEKVTSPSMSVDTDTDEVQQGMFACESTPSPRVCLPRWPSRMLSHCSTVLSDCNSRCTSRRSSVSALGSLNGVAADDEEKENKEKDNKGQENEGKEGEAQKTEEETEDKTKVIQLRVHPFVDEKDDTLCGACQKSLRETGCCTAQIRAPSFAPSIQSRIKEHISSAGIHQPYVISEVTGWI